MSNVTITPSVGTAKLGGVASAIAYAGALLLSGNAPALHMGTGINPASGALVAAGKPAIPPKRYAIPYPLTSWTLPADWNPNDNQIEVIGAGGAGQPSSASPAEGTGGAGGAYARISNLNLPSGTVIQLKVGVGGATAGAAGGDTWFNGASFGAASIAAKGGQGGPAGSGFAQGGQASASIGLVTASGGNGGVYQGIAGGGEGGGGAGGPNGNGAAGGNNTGNVTFGSGGGGASSGGNVGGNSSSVNGGAGGNNLSGIGGGAGAVQSISAANGGAAGGGGGGGARTTLYTAGASGGNGNDWANSINANGGGNIGAGPGGGGGGAGDLGNPGTGGLYGGGGGGSGGGTNTAFGSGANGIIIVSYAPLGPGVTLNSGAAVLTSNAPAVVTSFKLSTSTGSATLASQQAQVAIQSPGSKSVTPPAGALVIHYQAFVPGTSVALALAGQQAQIGKSWSFSVGVGALTVVGNSVGGLNLNVTPSTALTLLLKPGDIVTQTLTIPPPSPAPLIFTGAQPALNWDDFNSAPTQALTLAGLLPVIGRGTLIPTFTANTAVFDYFTRVNESPLANGTWTTVGVNGLQIISNQAVGGASGLSASAWAVGARTFTNQQYAQVQLTALNNFDNVGVTVLASAGLNLYMAEYIPNLSRVQVWKVQANVYTLLATALGQLSAGDVLGISVDASSGTSAVLVVYRNGAQITTATDVTSPILSGQPGLFYSYGGTNTTTIDNFVAIDLGVSSVVAAGTAPNLLSITLYPATGTLTNGGYAPVFYNGTALAPPFPGALALIGNTAGVLWSQSQAPLTGALALAGVASVVRWSQSQAPVAGALALTGVAPVFDNDINPASAGALTLTGRAGTTATQLTPATGALTFTSGSAGTGIAGTNIFMSPFAGSVIINGVAPMVGQTYTPVPVTGALVLNGGTPGLSLGTALTSGAATLGGNAPLVIQGAALVPATGTGVITGVVPSVGAGMSPVIATLQFTGTTASLAGQVFTTAGALALGGTQPALFEQRVTVPDAGGFGFTSGAATVSVGITLTTGFRLIALNGAPPGVAQSILSTTATGRLSIASDVGTSQGGNTTITPMPDPVDGSMQVAGLDPPVLYRPPVVRPGATILGILGTE